jgi:hypothetical protein
MPLPCWPASSATGESHLKPDVILGDIHGRGPVLSKEARAKIQVVARWRSSYLQFDDLLLDLLALGNKSI